MVKADNQLLTVQAGLTSLFMASMNGHLEVVRLLLENKADANLAESQTDQVAAQGCVCVRACVCVLVLACVLDHGHIALLHS